MKRFSILKENGGHDYIPYDFALQYDEQARKNHGGQSIDVLNSRGGLSWKEMFCAIKGIAGRDFHEATYSMREIDAKYQVLCEINCWVLNLI